MAIELPQGLQINSKQAVDTRILLTKAKMLTADENTMPVKYFAVCVDDGKLYLYDKNNTIDEVTGKFRLYEEVIDIPAALQHAIDTDPTSIDDVISQTLPGALAEALASQKTKGGLKVYEDGSIGIDYNDEQFNVTVDNKLELAISLIQAIDSN